MNGRSLQSRAPCSGPTSISYTSPLTATGESIPLRCLEGSPAFLAHVRMKPASLGNLASPHPFLC